ncbi:MAG TPA: sxtJ [Gammaproteobacteria bacterium]|nr:sxtJ [Gammaproteobacteria bacterium]
MTENTPKTSAQELRKFGLTTGAIVVVLFGLLLPWLFSRSYPYWPWVLAGILWVWALIAPATLKLVYGGWMKVGHVLGWINTRIILGLMFFTVFFAAGLILKALGKDPMSRKIDRSVESYRVASRVHTKDHVERPF